MTLLRLQLLLALLLLAGVGAGCYNSKTGETDVGGAINITLPVFPETGGNAVEIFNEMHYQPSFKGQEVPRIPPPYSASDVFFYSLPVAGSVPVTGSELVYTSIDAYRELTVPDKFVQSYDPERGQALFNVNCQVCHGQSLTGDGVILNFWPRDEETGKTRGAAPADLTEEPTIDEDGNIVVGATKNASDGELFGYISRGGKQGLALWLAGRESTSVMPEFFRLLTEGERWTLVQYLRSQIGGP